MSASTLERGVERSPSRARFLGTLRSRFALVLVLMSLLSLGPALLAHNVAELRGASRALDLGGSLRYRLLEIALVAREGRSEERRRLAGELRTHLERLINGDASLGVPPCPTPRVCAQLEEALRRWLERVEPVVLDERPEIDDLGVLLAELPRFDAAVHAYADALQTSLDVIRLSGRVGTGLAGLLVVLAALGVWDVFRRIRRIEAAAHGHAAETRVLALGRGSDEVAALARALGRALRDERRRAEVEQERALAQERENMAAFVGITRLLADELRNPLNNVSLQLQILERRAKAAGDGGANGAVETIRRDVARVTEVLGGYLGLGGGQAVPREPVDLRDVVARVLEAQRPLLEATGIELVQRLDAAPAVVVVAPSQLERLLKELVLNAIEAMMDRDERRLWIEVSANAQHAKVVVKDSGPGLPEPERAFVPGFSTKRDRSGMSLPICKQIARLHGGELTAQNTAPHGAELTLLLPIEKAVLQRSAGA